jgi:hypothetical protein
MKAKAVQIGLAGEVNGTGMKNKMRQRVMRAAIGETRITNATKTRITRPNRNKGTLSVAIYIQCIRV